MRFPRAAVLAAFFMLGILLAAASAHAQGAVQQQGAVVNGHLARWSGNAKLIDAGGSPGAGQQPTNPASPGILPTGLGVLNSGLGFCSYSAAASASYLQMCWGFSGGSGQITISGVGGAVPNGLNITVGSSTYPYPGPGNGDVMGPSSPATVVGHAAVWNNISGTLLADAGRPPALGPATTTVDDIAVWGDTAGTSLLDGNGVAISHTGSLAISATLSTGGLATLDSLSVTGAAAVGSLTDAGTLGVTGNASVGGTLAVTGTAGFTSISVSGATSLAGLATVGGGLDVTSGATTLAGSLTVAGATVLTTASVNSTFAMIGDATAQGALITEGAVQFLGLSTTPGGKQPLCVDIGTGYAYLGTGGAC